MGQAPSGSATPLRPFERILCPVDSSDFSARALRFATAIAAWDHAHIRVLSVRPPLSSMTFWSGPHALLPPEPPEATEEARDALRAFVVETTKRHDIDVQIEIGGVYPEILRAARQWPADLIVMGTHGLSGFQRLLLGSVTERVLRQTEIPVLTIPRDAEAVPERPFQTVLCAIDRSPTARGALDHAIALTRRCGGRLVVVHVVEHIADEDPQFAHHFDVAECFHELEPAMHEHYTQLIPEEARTVCHAQVELRFGKAAREILDAAGKCDAGIIVVGAAGASALFGSTAHEIVRAATIPVLVVPPPNS